MEPTDVDFLFEAIRGDLAGAPAAGVLTNLDRFLEAYLKVHRCEFLVSPGQLLRFYLGCAGRSAVPLTVARLARRAGPHGLAGSEPPVPVELGGSWAPRLRHVLHAAPSLTEELILSLLKAGAPPVPDVSGCSLLAAACQRRLPRLALKLLSEHALPADPLALELAVEAGWVEIVGRMLAAGIPPNSGRVSPLRLAARLIPRDGTAAEEIAFALYHAGWRSGLPGEPDALDALFAGGAPLSAAERAAVENACH